MKFPKLIARDLRDEKLIFRIVGNAIGEVLLFTRLTANQLTVIRNILLLPICYLFYKATATTYFWGGLACLIVLTLDFSDGHMARKRQSVSKLGAWMERVFDTLFFTHFSLFGFFVALGIFLRTGNSYIWMLLFINLYGSFANNLAIMEEKAILGGEHAGTSPTSSKFLFLINEKVTLFLMWANLFVFISAILYGQFLKIGIDSIIVIYVIITIINQIKWIGRIILRLALFTKGVK